MAAYCGKAGIDCDIYVPSNTSLGKTAQISVYGANLIKIQGSREDTALAAMEAGCSMFYASHNWSPFFEHGVKTYVYEMWEQLGHELPDVIIVPCGNGSLVTSAYLAIEELVGQGRAAKRPRLVGVQSEKCDPLARAWEQGLDSAVQVQKGTTIAEGIASALPVKSKQILEAVRKSSGLFVTVSDKDIIHALKTLASQGIFIEPTSATAPAAAIKLHEQGLFGEKEMVTVELTGTGLKAMDKVCKF
jgi:threonine synthase